MLKFSVLSAVFMLGLYAQAQADNHRVIYQDSQGWTQSQSRVWYEESQGSRLIRTDWLKALHNKDGSAFFTRSALEAWGYLYFSKQPDAWPVGFIRDSSQNQSWLGFNCSACHTAKLKANGNEVIIHGGQSMADFQAFVDALVAAVQNVADDEASFEKFASDLLGANITSQAKTTLKSDIANWLAFRAPIQNTGKDSHWGRGRADAVGIILATTAAVVADPKIPLDEREPFPESNAPVSYPFVWNANQQARLQHNGVVDNGADLGLVKVAKIGALIRNWTEALGVFAEVKLDDQAETVNSSIRLDNLLKIEQALAELQSPQWPAGFGALDETRRENGAALFKQECAACHGTLAAADTETFLPLKGEDPKNPPGFIIMQPLFDDRITSAAFEKDIQPKPEYIGTDPAMACNALTHKVLTGQMQGQRNQIDVMPSLSDKKFGARAVTTDLLRVLIQRDVLKNKGKLTKALAGNQWAAAKNMIRGAVWSDVEDDFEGQSLPDDPLGPLKDALGRCATAVEHARAMDPESPLPVYKSRPLNGIWATAPYLHNGSVPTLYDLLLPQAERPKNFGYFDGEMDVVKGGLKDASTNPAAFIFNVFNKDGIVVQGNWNGGHNYGTTLSHEQRLDLVEYLKGL